MATEPKNRDPQPLIAALEETAERRGMSRRRLAEELGVTYGYVAQLKSGARPTSQLSDALLDSCADFLGLPRIAVLVMAGRVQLSDFYLTDPGESFDARVRKALELIKADPNWGSYFPESLLAADADPAIQRYVVQLYEAATGTRLLGQPWSPDQPGMPEQPSDA